MKTTEEKCYWVYILRCENDTFNNLNKRYQAHLDGTSKCKYTRSFKPVCIAKSWEIKSSKAFAMQVERQIKKLSRIEKEGLIASSLTLDILLANEFSVF